jgi:hypothetical protein
MNFSIKNGALFFGSLTAAYFANLVFCILFYSDFFLPCLIAPFIWIILPLAMGINEVWCEKVAFKVSFKETEKIIINKTFFSVRKYQFIIYK